MKSNRPFKRALAMLSAVVLALGIFWMPMPTVTEIKAEDKPQYPFMDTSLSYEERAADLVSRLTLEEKAAQIGNNNPAIGRLGIPKYDYWKEGLHGVANIDPSAGQSATSFPYSVALASSWDTELVERVATAISDEARAYNNQGLRGLSYWSPTINLARDPRWGRNHETYGEDVALTTAIGTSFVQGYQGTNEDNKGYLKVISTLKHYAVNNSEYNRHNGTSDLENVYLREYYTKTFKNIIQNTDIRQAMSSYNRINGTPASANVYLLDTLLRKTFGFQGYVTSDCGAIKNMVDDHKWVPEGQTDPINYEEAVMYGELAGCDMDCGGVYPGNAVGAVRSGILSEDVIDKALVRIFTQRFYTGEFDPAEMVPWRSEAYSYDNIVESEANVQLAEDSSDESIVLMKNEPATGETAPILPLNPTESQNVVVLGGLASQNILGGYSGVPSKENISTPLQGIQNLLGHEVTFIEGGANSTKTQYICNSRNLKLIKGEEEVVLPPTQATGFTGGCRLENNTNVGYITANKSNYYYYPNVDIRNTTAIAIETSGGGDTLQGTVEIHIDAPDGMILTKIDTAQTGSWGNYQYFQADVSSLGGYEFKDLYVVFTPSVVIEDKVEFTADQTQKIKDADVVIACIGSQGGDSSEGNDREDIEMPRNQGLLVKAAADINPRTVVYIQSVGCLEIGQFKDSVPAILWTCYNGQAQGNAMARVIFGEHNPTAKLPFTWYADDDQLPTIDDYNLYQEDYTNGGWTYQYFTGDVDYPFGHGISYATFEYDNLTLSAGSSYQMGDVDGKDGVTAADALMALQVATKKISLTDAQTLRADVDGKDGITANDALQILQCATKKIDLPIVGDNNDVVTANDTLTATVDVKNTGSVDSKEVVQLYISSPKADGKTRPLTQLKAFEKVAIAAGETKTVTLEVALEDVSFWSEEEQKFIYDSGEYTVFVGPSSDKAMGLTDQFTMSGEYKPSLSVVTADPDKVVLNAARPDKVLTIDLTATLTDDSFIDVTKETVTYTSNRPEVATVKDGIVTPVGEGVATITATVTKDGVTKSDSFAIAVINELKIDAILLDGEPMTTFDSNTTSYYYPVAGNTAPVVSIPEMGDQFDVEITQATAVPGNATVKVTLGDQTVSYAIQFRPLSEEYVVATFSGAENRYSASKSTLQVPWTTVDGGQPVDLMGHHLDDLYLTFTLTLKNGQEGLDDTQAFRSGYVKLRSVDQNGENNRGWGLGSQKLTSGVNYVRIPLSRVSEISNTGTIDWTQINRFNLYIDSTNNQVGPFTMLVEDVKIIDTRYSGTAKHLQALVDETVKAEDYLPASYATYTAAKEAAEEVLAKSNPTDKEITDAIATLTDAKAKLERKVDKTALSEAINKPIDETLYTADSVQRYKEALVEAQKVLDDENATQDQVDEAVRAVNTARGKLKKPNTEPVLATFSGFDKEYSAQAGNWLYGNTLYADWKTADKTPIDLEGDRTGLYLIMTMSFKSTKDIDLSKCWESATIKLRSAELNGENNYGWNIKSSDPEVTATATPGVFKIAIPLTAEADNTKGNMDWGTVERIITTTMITGVGDYRVVAGESNLTMTLSGTQIVDSALFDLAAWKAE